MAWLPVPRALVPGDRLLGDEAGGVRLCPESWIEPDTTAGLRTALQPLRALDIELILVSHGEPVLSAGSRALARVL